MRPTNSVGWAALAVAALALTAAGSGAAAYAAAATVVNIADPLSPTQVARVKSGGRLSTAGQTATIDVTKNVATPANGQLTTLIQPTTATLGVSGLSLANPRVNSAASNANYTIYLEKDPVDATTGVCTRTGATILDMFLIAPGERVDKVYATPLLIKATTGSTKYCLSLWGSTTNGASDTGPYFANATLTAFVDAGTYTAAASLAAAEAQPDLSPVKP